MLLVYDLELLGASYIKARPRENSELIKSKPRSRSNPNHNSQRRHIISEYSKTTTISNLEDPSSPMEPGTTSRNKDNKNSPQKKRLCAKGFSRKPLLTQRGDDIERYNEDHFCVLFIGLWLIFSGFMIMTNH